MQFYNMDNYKSMIEWRLEQLKKFNYKKEIANAARKRKQMKRKRQC